MRCVHVHTAGTFGNRCKLDDISHNKEQSTRFTFVTVSFFLFFFFGEFTREKHGAYCVHHDDDDSQGLFLQGVGMVDK